MFVGGRDVDKAKALAQEVGRGTGYGTVAAAADLMTVLNLIRPEVKPVQ